MKVTTPEISWHEREPIYSVDFQPGDHSIQRLASCGVDKLVRVWHMTYDSDGKGQFEFLSNLRRHTASVNVVRFSKNGVYLASAGDDCSVLVWTLSENGAPTSTIFSEDDGEEDKEVWVCYKTLRGHLGDVQDLSWSKDSRYLVSGSVDNSAIVWDVKKAQKIAFFNDHKSYVQGVTFDPLGDYIATLSSDRSMRIFSLSSKNCVHNVSKMTPVLKEEQSSQNETKPKSFRIFHDDGLRSFFRRLEFSCDGHLLVAPAGCMETGEKVANVSYVFVRGAFAKPALYLPSGEKATIVVRTNPQLFELRPPKDFTPEETSDDKPAWETHKSLFSLPYRVVFAVATDDSVLIYDSQQTMPVGLMKNIHYHQISDLSWTSDGLSLIISSTDGFCTVCTFDEGELGIPYVSGSRRKRVATQPAPEVEKSDKEKSPVKEKPTELPFSRYADKEEKTEEKVAVINTKLNIRRVAPKPGTDSSEKADKKDTEKSPKVNTVLNIRKVKKDEAGKSEEKKNSRDYVSKVESMEINDVEMADDSKKKEPKEVVTSDDKSSPEVIPTDNTTALTQPKKRVQLTTISLK